MPSLDDLGRVLELIVRMKADQQIFDGLEDPGQIESLREKGYFRYPPEPLTDEKEGYIIFPAWPAMRYLARVAGQKPDIVADIIQEMEEVHNIAFTADAIDALLAMPPNVSARLLEKILPWAENPYLPHPLPAKFSQLMVRWAKAYQTEAAVRLGRTLLDLLPAQVGTEEGGEPLYEIADVGQMEQFVRKHYLKAIREVGSPALELLRNILEEEIEMRAGDQELGED